jgi:hypothetical protein
VRSSWSSTISPEMVWVAFTTDSTSICSASTEKVVCASAGQPLAELGVGPIDLPDLGVGAPARVAGLGLAQVGLGDAVEAAAAVEARGQLVGQACRWTKPFPSAAAMACS